MTLGVKNPPASAGDTGDISSIPGSGRSTEGAAWQPSLMFLPGESQGQRSLAGCSPWGHKESDTTERLSRLPQGKNTAENVIRPLTG